MSLPSNIDKKLARLGRIDIASSGIEAQNENGTFAHELCQWICSTEQYKSVTDWGEGDIEGNDFGGNTEGDITRHALLITGGQGVNKTALMEEIVRHLSSEANLENPDLKDDSDAMPMHLSYYSCGPTSHGIDNSTCVLRSLIYSLLKQQPKLITHLDEALVSTKRYYFDSPYDFFALSALFFKILDDEDFIRSYLVIDGIDKCSSGHGGGDHNLGDLMRLIQETSDVPCKIRWLLSADVDDHVEFDLIREKHYRGIDLGRTSGTPELERIFDRNVIAIVDQLAEQKNYLEPTKHDVSQFISGNSQGNTLWTVIACAILRKKKNSHAIEVIETMPESLSELYEYIRTDLKELPRQEFEHCKSVLSTMAIVYRPLNASELARLAGLPSQVDPLTVVEKCVLLEVQSGIVKFIDPAARQDTLQKLRQKPTKFSKAHSLIAGRALGFISAHFKTATSPLPERVRFCYEGKKERLVDVYGTLHWIMHLLNVKDIAKEAETANSLVSFMKNHFLVWIDTIDEDQLLVDALVLMKKLEGVLLKQAGEEESDLLKTDDSKKPKRDILEQSGQKEQSHILSLVQDGIQIVRSHMSRNIIINTNPHRVVFYPEESPLKQDWMAKNKTWLITPPKMAHSWRDSPLTLADWGSISSISFSPDGKFLAAASMTYDVCVWDAETGEVQLTLQDPKNRLQHVAFSPNGRLAAFSENGDSLSCDLSTGRRLFTSKGRKKDIRAIRFSPKAGKGERLLLVTTRRVHCRDFEDFSEQPYCSREECLFIGFFYAVDFSQQERWIATGNNEGDIEIWDARRDYDYALHTTIHGHERCVNSVAFSRDEERLVSGSDDMTVKIWSVETGANLKSFDCAQVIRAVAFSPDDSFIAAGFGNQINIWESESGVQRCVLRGHKEPVTTVAFSPQGRLASGSVDGILRLWDLEGYMSKDMKVLGEPVRDDRISCIAMSPNGKYMASTSGKDIHLWDGMTGMPMEHHELSQDGVTSISFSPDGKSLVSSSRDGLVKVWDVASGSVYRTFKGHSNWVSFATFSFGGVSIASASDDRTVRIWSCLSEAEGGVARVLRGHKSHVKTVAFSPDGRSLVSGDDDSIMIIWDRESRRPKKKVTVSGKIIDVSFSQDSSKIVSRSDDCKIWIWDSNTGALIQGPIEAFKPNRYIGFNLRMPEYILTECGVDLSTLDPSPFPVQEGQKGARYGVAPDGTSITWVGRCIIPIPEKYRPTASWVQGNIVAIGTNWGKVLLFRFSTDPQAEECVKNATDQHIIMQTMNSHNLDYYYLLPSRRY